MTTTITDADIDIIVDRLTPYATQGFAASLIAGSHMHGLATASSDIDLAIIRYPTPRDILFGNADTTLSHHAPDIKIMTPLRFTRLILKGVPIALEALQTPKDCRLFGFDDATPGGRWMLGICGYAPLLTGPDTIRMALGNMRANLGTVESKPMDEAKRWKLLAETLRLAWSVDHVFDHGGAWPARLDANHLLCLRQVRAHGCDHGKVVEEVNRVGHRFDLKPPSPVPTAVRSHVLDLTENLHRRIVDEGIWFPDGVEAIRAALEGFRECAASSSL